jgi:curved DNA-binding protein CbpA
VTGARQVDPFEVLGLRADDDLTDDDVRAAWRRIAAATHPDRDDGGAPERFALAAAAYTELRTSFGRGEARAELADGAGLPAAGWHPPGSPIWSRIRSGRPGRLALRLTAAVAAGTAGVLAAGPGSAAAPALAVGALTWFLLTARADLAARSAGVRSGRDRPYRVRRPPGPGADIERGRQPG